MVEEAEEEAAEEDGQREVAEHENSGVSGLMVSWLSTSNRLAGTWKVTGSASPSLPPAVVAPPPSHSLKNPSLGQKPRAPDKISAASHLARGTSCMLMH